jgi:hypothetical protein
MANPNTPRGLIPYRYTSGAPYNGSANIYAVASDYAVALYLGQPLVATGASDANGIPYVQTATAGSAAYTLGPMVGIVDGGNPVVAVVQNLPIYHPASTLQYILVADDPNLLFWIQEDSAGGAVAMATAGMKNADLVAGSGSTATGWSGWMLDSNTVNTTNTLQLRLISGLQEADNTMGANYAKWLVKINLHSLTNTTGV